MKGWVLVEPEGIEDDGQLKAWIERAMMFVETLLAKIGGHRLYESDYQKPRPRPYRRHCW